MVAAALKDALDDIGGARRVVLDARPAVLSRYDWARTATRTLAALQEAARS